VPKEPPREAASDAPPQQESELPDAAPGLPPESGPWQDASLPPHKRAELLVSRMAQAEKLILVFGYYGSKAAWKGYEPPAEARPGSAGFVPGIPRLGIPPQWQTDAGIGVATQGSAPKKLERTALPSGLATTASWDPDLAQKSGSMIGAEARSSGFNVMLAGGVNLLRDAHCGRNFEYGGEDPYLAGIMVGAQIAGIQSSHVISTIKHFAFNDQETDRDKGDSVVDDAEARMSDLLAFEFAFERGDPGSVMCAYNKTNGVHSCESEYLLTDVLRGEFGFSGYVLSDWGAVHSTVRAANSGLEQLSGWPFDEQAYFGKPLSRAISEGKVTQKRLDEMVTRILTPMFKHGLFEHPVQPGPIDEKSHAEITRQGAEAGAVLLKNEKNILPLGASSKKIVVIGGHADKGVLSGGGSSQVYPVGGNAVPGLVPTTWPGPVVYYPSPPLAALKELLPGAVFTFDPGTTKESAIKAAEGADVAIVFSTQWTTESIDTDVVLPDGQDELISAVSKVNPNTIVVLETGGPVLMPWANSVRAILQAWYPGTEGGRAIARLLTGAVNPSGHLPHTVPQKREHWARPQAPAAGRVEYTEGATVGYKWFDAKGHEPLFEFGHGLSYTSFVLQGLKADKSGQSIRATFTVTNNGNRAGAHVAQIYVAHPGWEGPQRLGGFSKVLLSPGESKEVTLAIDPRLLAKFDSKTKSWKVAEGDYEVRLGSSSRKIAQRSQVRLAGAAFTSTELRKTLSH
jgi:beta-glucosidase